MTVTAANHPDISPSPPDSIVGALVAPQRLPYTLALLTALSCTVLSVPMTLAGIASNHAERALQHWDQSDSAPSKAYWETTLARAERATNRYPVASGEYLDRLGRVLAWAPLADPEGDAEIYMRSSLAVLNESLESRATWPWTWLRVAYGKRALLEYDEEFSQALMRADQLGRGRIEVSKGLAQLGFMSWADLDRDQRSLTLAAAGRAVAHSPDHAKQIHDIAQASNLGTPLCWTLSNDLKMQQGICKEADSP